MGNNVLLEARDLGFAYPRGTETVFTGASFLIYAGDKTALLGDSRSRVLLPLPLSPSRAALSPEYTRKDAPEKTVSVREG